MTTVARKSWNERRVLVTGATGILGSWLTKALLARGATVVALVLDVDPQSEIAMSGDVNRVKVVYGPVQDTNPRYASGVGIYSGEGSPYISLLEKNRKNSNE